MTTAGTPATATHAINPIVPDVDRLEDFELLLAAGSKRRIERAEALAGGENSVARPTDWCDPNPQAVVELGPGEHPIDRTLDRCKAGPSRDEFVGKIRRCYELMAGVELGAMTMDEVRTVPIHQMTVRQAAAFRRLVYARYLPQSTRNDMVSVIRRILKQCRDLGLISAERLDNLYEELYTLAPGPSTKRFRLTDDGLGSLLHTAATRTTERAGVRNTAIIALFATSGIRSIEMAGIRLDDWDRSDQSILLRDTKNRRDHRIYLHPAAVPYLERWLEHRGTAPGALFTSLNHRRRPVGVLPDTIQFVVSTLGKEAGLTGFASHDFRRSFVTRMLQRHDTVLVSKLVNHAKVQSTMVYDLRGAEEERAAVASLDLRHVRASEIPTGPRSPGFPPARCLTRAY